MRAPKVGQLLWCTWDMGSFQNIRPTRVKVREVDRAVGKFYGDIKYGASAPCYMETDIVFPLESYMPVYSEERAGAVLNCFNTRKQLVAYCIVAVQFEVARKRARIERLQEQAA